MTSVSLRLRSASACLSIGAFLLSVLAGSAPVSAQVLYGSIIGNVVDETGSAVPGAAVTISAGGTGASREVVSDATGAFRFLTVQPGTYTVTVKVDGFRTFVRPDVAVNMNDVARVDAALVVGSLTETVTVSADTPMLQSDRAEVRSELKTRDLVNLPVSMNRNYQYLFRVLPGFTPPAEAHSVPSNPSRALVFNVNGASRSSNNVRIDGVSTTNIWLPHVAAYVPALESLETVNVVTNSFDAEQGLAGGSAINVQIKSGTNNLHGSAFEYFTNESLRTKNYFAPPGTPKGNWKYNQFGGTVGGPIVRNRAFFFASYEGTRDEQTLNRTVSVPTEALRRGDLRASPTHIYNPFTGTSTGAGRTPFENNIIPAEMIDPTAARLLALLPLPNLRTASGGIAETNNYFAQAPFVLNRNTLDTKLNWVATEKMNIFGRFSVLDFFTENGTNFGKELQGQPLGSSNPGTGEGNTYNVSAGATYTLSSTLVMDAHVGFVRMNTGVAQSDIDENKGLNVLGLPGTNGPNDYEGGTPLFDLDTYADLGTTDTFMPYLPQRRSVSDGAERQLDQGRPQRQVRHRHLLSGAQPHAAGDQRRRQSGGARRLPIPIGADPDPGRAGRQPVQRLRVVPAGRTQPHWPAQAGRALYDAKLAVQPLRSRPVAGLVEGHPLVRHSLGVLPGADPRPPRPRAVQRRHEPDHGRRHRQRARRPGCEREQDDVRAAPGDDLACLGGHGRARRLRHHQRPVLAGQAVAHQSPGGAQPAARRAQLAVVLQPHMPRASRSSPIPISATASSRCRARSPSSRWRTSSFADISGRSTPPCRRS